MNFAKCDSVQQSNCVIEHIQKIVSPLRAIKFDVYKQDTCDDWKNAQDDFWKSIQDLKAQTNILWHQNYSSIR